MHLRALFTFRYFAICLGVIFLCGMFVIGLKNTPSDTDQNCTLQSLTDEKRDELLQTIQTFRINTLAALVRQFDESTGFFIYKQHTDGRISSDDSDIRQLLASRILAREARKGDIEISKLHEQNLVAIFKNWYHEDGDISYILRDNKAKLGANALLVLTLVESPLFIQYEQEARKLINGIVRQLHDSGSFEPWFVEPKYTYDRDYLLTFYSGEAILALVSYAEKTGDDSIFAFAERAQKFYIEQYVVEINSHYYPAYVPWHTLSLERLYTRTGKQQYLDPIFVLNDKLLELQDRTEYVGRFYNPKTPQYGSPHASSDAVYTEGLAAAYGVAKKIGDCKHTKTYQAALMIAFAHLQTLQLTETLKDLNPHFIGGIITNASNYWIRIDSMAHTIDALDQLTTVFGTSEATLGMTH